MFTGEDLDMIEVWLVIGEDSTGTYAGGPWVVACYEDFEECQKHVEDINKYMEDREELLSDADGLWTDEGIKQQESGWSVSSLDPVKVGDNRFHDERPKYRAERINLFNNFAEFKRLNS